MSTACWINDTEEGTHCYLFHGNTATHIPNTKALEVQQYFGTKVAGSREKPLDKSFWGSYAILDGPLAGL